MIRRGGENIAAREVEQAIGGHPADFLAQHIAAFKHPQYVTMVRDFPLTPSDRVEKHKLRVAGNPHVVRTFALAEGRWLP